MRRIVHQVRGLLRVSRRTLVVVPQAVESILVLPTLVQQLDRVARNTDVLPDLRREFSEMSASIKAMEHSTATMAVHVPTLVILEQSLPAMVPVLEDLDKTVQRLAEVAEPLQGAALRVGRLADRLPQRNGRHAGLR